ncbi:MAG: class I SAM-dependent methyltransferase [Thermodesulfobacteriota bacterium]
MEIKTDDQTTISQARWAGLKPGMRVADIGCGHGKTTYVLNQVAQPGGAAVGIDISPERIRTAKEQYAHKTIQYVCRDIHDSLDDLGTFDFIWVRFFLEYFRSTSAQIVANITRILKPGGILCLIDLDYNCLNHFGLSDRLKRSLWGIMNCLQEQADFDPHVGIKLYSFLYDMDFTNIDVNLAPHHLIFGELNQVDAFNWTKKVEVAGKYSGYSFSEYEGGYDDFFEEFTNFFHHPRRFTYTPIISCRGEKPLHKPLIGQEL